MRDSDNGSSSHRPRWLCIAYAFPPVNRSGTYRTLAFLNDLDRLGWDATVVTAEPGNEPTDESLLTRIPTSTTVMRVPWIDLIHRIKDLWPDALRSWSKVSPSASESDTSWRWNHPKARQTSVHGMRQWFSQWFVTPDSRVGWIAPAVRAGLDTARRLRPDVIYSTSPYNSAHLIAMILARWCRVPWVADFRDPWRDNPFRNRGSWTVECWDDLLEWAVLGSADHVICNTPTMTRRLCWRRPFVARKSSTIPNGFDAGLLRGVAPKRVAPSDTFTLAHAGQFYGPRSPVIWFRALRWALDRTAELAGKVRMVLVGSESFEGRRLDDITREAGVHRNVTVLGRKTHRETLSYLAGSDALMLAGSDGPGSELQVPNKLFEYLAIRKPIVATCAATSPIVQILRDARARALVCHPNDEVALTDAIVRLATESNQPLQGDWSGVDQFERRHRSRQLLDVFRRVSRAHRRRTGRILMSTEASVSASWVPQQTPVQVAGPRLRRSSTGVTPLPVMKSRRLLLE